MWKEVAGVRTYFVYADEGLVAEADGSGNIIKSYGYKPGSIWTTDPLFMKVGSEYYFYQNDHLGTPQKLTAVNGAVVWSAMYSSFGQADVDPLSTVVNNLRFPGQYYDQETGLHYNWHRYYDPKSGRYFKKDPIGLKGGLNLFQYALSNPIRKYDYNGLAVTTVDAYCRRYPKACRELFPKRPVPIPPPVIPVPIQDEKNDPYISDDSTDDSDDTDDLTESIEQPEPLIDDSPIKEFNLDLCKSMCVARYECQPVMRQICYKLCYVALAIQFFNDIFQ